jgi:predicted metal-dependent phosphoesterase TrpH
MFCDLHIHTHYSDGNWSPKEVVEEAIRLKLAAIAITDHDTTAGIEEATDIASKRIKIIPGIEFNTIYTDINDQKQDVHILGYFIDPNNKHLQNAIGLQKEARIELVNNTIQKFADYKIQLSFDQIKKCASLGSIGRPHICQALVNEKIVSSIDEAFELVMNKASKFYLKRNSIPSKLAIEAIVLSGGIASLAHPLYNSSVYNNSANKESLEYLLKDLMTSGLKAVEVYHSRHSLDDIEHLKQLTDKYNLYVTGGSDCHGPFENNPALLGTVKIPYSSTLFI